MPAYSYSMSLLSQPYSEIQNSEDLEKAVFAKFGTSNEIEDEIWEAWEDFDNQ